ncbi:MAG: hypothetical protein ACLQEG_05090 [Acidimicrobiales bacterium]
MPGRDAGPSSTLGPDARTGLVDPFEGYRVDALARRRAQRDARADLERVGEVLAALNAGEVGLDEAAAMIAYLGSRLGASACRGSLAS